MSINLRGSAVAAVQCALCEGLGCNAAGAAAALIDIVKENGVEGEC